VNLCGVERGHSWRQVFSFSYCATILSSSSFHRPGAGKTTISQAAVHLLDNDGIDDNDNGLKDPKMYHHLYLDLDVCVPQWMRDNFSKGMYPTLLQRAEFISNACDYVNEEIASYSKTDNKPSVTIVSFSFVNTDLRTAFRSAFPHAKWILVDTTKRMSEKRISAREGHFYKNASQNNVEKDKDRERMGDVMDEDDDNSEWEFKPVDFPHVVLNGSDSVEDNAKRIVDIISHEISL